MYAVDGRPSNPLEHLPAVWASLKHFRPRDGNTPAGDGARYDGSRNPEVDFRGQRRPKEAHHSTPDAVTADAEHQPGDCQEDDHPPTAPVEPGQRTSSAIEDLIEPKPGASKGVVYHSVYQYQPARWRPRWDSAQCVGHGPGKFARQVAPAVRLDLRRDMPSPMGYNRNRWSRQ